VVTRAGILATRSQVAGPEQERKYTALEGRNTVNQCSDPDPDHPVESANCRGLFQDCR
jgi:hypothetical protein